MNYKRLETTICKVIKEQQIKIGYQSETIRLYYPLGSLNIQLGEALGVDEMISALASFSEFTKERLGEVTVSHEGERFCLRFMPKASEYVHNTTEDSGFMYDLIALMSQHGVEIAQVKELFSNYSSSVVYKKLEDEDFDYLLYFDDEIPDEDYYCFKEEGHHMTYHRFTKEDYQELIRV